MKVKYGIIKIIFIMIIKIAIPMYILINFNNIFNNFGIEADGILISVVAIILFMLITIDKTIREILELIEKNIDVKKVKEKYLW